MRSISSIVKVGSFDNDVASQINDNFAALQAVDVWVRPQVAAGIVSPDGSWGKPYRSLSAIPSSVLVAGLVIGLEGVLLEEFTTPLGVNNVTILGYQVTPRQATTGGVPNGGGATWLSPSAGVGALLTVQGQGWTVANIYFNNSAVAAPCINLLVTGDPPAAADAAHFLAQNCIFTGSDDGILATGGTNFCAFKDCTFFNFAGAGDRAVSTAAGLGIATLLGWSFENCVFRDNDSHIVAAFSHVRIRNCFFDTAAATVIDLSGGEAPNMVINNAFNIAAANFDPAGGVTGVNGDVWSNILTDAIETGLPAN